MKLTKDQKKGMWVILMVAFVTVLTVYLFISILFKVQLLSTPCELCVESQPYLKSCFHNQMFVEELVPGGIDLPSVEKDSVNEFVEAIKKNSK